MEDIEEVSCTTERYWERSAPVSARPGWRVGAAQDESQLIQLLDLKTPAPAISDLSTLRSFAEEKIVFIRPGLCKAEVKHRGASFVTLSFLRKINGAPLPSFIKVANSTEAAYMEVIDLCGQ